MPTRIRDQKHIPEHFRFPDLKVGAEHRPSINRWPRLLLRGNQDGYQANTAEIFESLPGVSNDFVCIFEKLRQIDCSASF